MGEGLKRARKAALATRNQGTIVHANDKTFTARTKKGLVLVDFWAHWCQPCRAMAPILQQLAAVTPDLRVVKINVESHADKLVKKFAVNSIPRFVFLRDGVVVGDHVGATSLAKMQLRVAEAREEQP